MKGDVFGLIHCHSDHSLRDGAMTIQQLCARAAEMNAKAVTLTDHGTCTGWIEFMKTCKQYQINGIPGVEAYVKTEFSSRAHLVLLAKNYQGYQEICRAVTQSNNHQINLSKVNTAIMTKEILEECFGNGNVFALSGCINGIIGSIFLRSENNRKKIAKIEMEMQDYQKPEEDQSHIKESLEQEIESLSHKKNSLQALAKKSYTKRTKGVEILKITTPELYEQEKAKLEEEINESEWAKKELEFIKSQLKRKRTERTLLNNKIKLEEEQSKKYHTLKEKRLHLLEEVKNEQSHAEQELKWFHHLFQEDFYMEIQYHGMEEESTIMPRIIQLAKKHQIPVVATNDAHFAVPEDAEVRQYIRALRFEKWQEDEESERNLYLKSDDELYEAIRNIADEETARTAMQNIRNICQSCHVELPQEKHYPRYIENGKPVQDTKKLLWEKALQGIDKRYPNGGFDDDKKERLKYEYQVICDMGYADYLLIVADFVNYAKEYSIWNHPTKLGYGAGPGRGSGVGSLINYLLGITALEPTKYGLIFERFLNKDRVSMPDIDVDFSKEVRPYAIQYVAKKYGESNVVAIHTRNKTGSKESIHNGARILYWKSKVYENTDKKNYFQRLGNEIAASIPSTPNIKLEDCKDILKKYQGNKDAEKIIRIAEKIEGKIISLGVHAAGIIIGDGNPLNEYIPILYNRDLKQWAVQCDMVEAEEIGLLKMDFLGLKTLDILTDCIRNIKKSYGYDIDLERLPMEPEVFREIFSKGKTNCVFQLESEGMKQMLREFQPESFEDLILLIAAYRPGPMEFIPNIIEVKKRQKKAEYIIPELEKILKSTYGKPIYQEQLMDIFHTCAGFTLGEADIIRRYMSKKKVDKFIAYRPKFIAGIQEHGATKEQAEELWESLVDFAKYAFNKSHAAIYALICYQTAWLKYHYPDHFLCAVLNYNDTKKIPFILNECKNIGIKVLHPDINLSYRKFIVAEKNIIRYGFQAISGIDQQADVICQEREKNGLYQSFCDYLFRAYSNKGDTEKLIKAGAFDYCDSTQRIQLLTFLEDQAKNVSLYYKKQKIVNRILQELSILSNKKEQAQTKKRLENAKKTVEQVKSKIIGAEAKYSVLEDKQEILKGEFEVLGSYLSGHPMDAYEELYKQKGVLHLCDCEVGKYNNYIGLIENVRYAERKADGKPMAFFTFSDQTSTVEVNCFADVYESCASMVQNGQVVKIYGKVTEEEKYNEDGKEIKLTVSSMKRCYPHKPPIFLSVVDLQWYQSYVKEKLSQFITEDGFPVYLHDSSNGNIFKLPERVSSDVLQLEIKNTYIKEFYSDKVQ